MILNEGKLFGFLRLFIEQFEAELEKTQLSDLQFMKKGGNLGKGAYGQVEMALHKRLGIKLAVKKIDKRSL